MSIRPIDIVTIAPKSQEASQIHANQLMKNEQVHSQIGEVFNKEVEREREQTTKTNKSEGEEYNLDPRDQSKNSYYHSKKKKRNKNDSNKQKTNNEKNGHIDIKI